MKTAVLKLEDLRKLKEKKNRVEEEEVEPER